MASKINWGCCSSGEDGGSHVICIQCNLAFHNDCLHLKTNRSIDKQWKCPKCAGRKINQDNTPTSGFTQTRLFQLGDGNTTKRTAKRHAISSPPEDSNKALSRDDVSNIVKDAIKTEMNDLLLQMQTSLTTILNKELQPLKTEILEMKESMQFINKQYEEFKIQHEATVRTVDKLKTENGEMQSIIRNLGNRITQLEQHSRSCNIEIQCVPENKTENLISIVSKLAKVIKSTVSAENIVKCSRVAKIDTSSSRPRSIVVQLSSPNIRDEFLAAAKSYNRTKNKVEDKLNTTDIGYFGSKSSIYITEHLSPALKALHSAARRRAKTINYKYIWVKNNKIFVRKNEESDYIYIKDTASLEKIV